jgi:hypothetical protein
MLAVYLRTDEPDPHLFRTLFDHWFGYRMGGPFLNGGGRPHWFNAVTTTKLRLLGPALQTMNFISVEAAKVFSGRSDKALVKDHGIPLAIARERCRAAFAQNPEALRHTLIENAWLGVITKEEHDCLNRMGARKSLPTCDVDAMRKRYSEAGILECLEKRPFEARSNAHYEHLMDVVPSVAL